MMKDVGVAHDNAITTSNRRGIREGQSKDGSALDRKTAGETLPNPHNHPQAKKKKKRPDSLGPRGSREARRRHVSA